MRYLLPLLLTGCLINTDLRDERLKALDDDCTDDSDWFRDDDGDGFGTASDTVEACTQPDGYAAKTGDCDDAQPGVNPAADERCNGIDDDCDGELDGSDSVDATSWYPDSDGDGYGSTAGRVMACEPPPGMVTQPDDCDDENPDLNPAADEVCNGIDDNCNAQIDEVGALDGYPVWADADQDGFGDPDVESTACGLAANWVPDASDCDDSNPAVNPTGVDTAILDGNCDGSHSGVNIADYEIYGNTGDLAGAGLAGVGDVNGDGLDDWVVGGPGADANGYDSGVAWLVLGNPSAQPDANGWDAAIPYIGENEGHFVGYAIAGAGDFDGDGFDDIVLGSVHNSGGLGGAWLIPGSASPAPTNLSQILELSGDALGSDTGAAVAGLGDVNGDGFDDLAIGAPLLTNNGDTNGGVYLVNGGPMPTAEVDLGTADMVLRGSPNSRAGASLAAGGDVDGDGAPDYWVGGPGYDANGGMVWLGTDVGVVGDIELDQIATAAWMGSRAERAGAAIAGGIDVNGDGYDDGLVGAPQLIDGLLQTGGAYLLLGSAQPPTLETFENADGVWTGGDDLDDTGVSVAALGDVNGDGFGDLLVGASGALGGTGIATLVLGSPMPAAALDLSVDGVALRAESPMSALGSAVGAAGDTNGDGLDDLLVGGPTHTHLSLVDTGGAYLVFGQPL